MKRSNASCLSFSESESSALVTSSSSRMTELWAGVDERRVVRLLLHADELGVGAVLDVGHELVVLMRAHLS